MEARIWGARGSYPASGARFSHFGHHTACVTLATGDDLVVLDAGSGAAVLGETLGDRSGASPVRRLHVLLSHFHHDHVMGLPFLLHGAGAGVEISIHTALGEAAETRAVLTRLFTAPYFPAEAEELFGRVVFHAHPVGARFGLAGISGDIAVETALLEHPGGSTAFRVSCDQRALVYATDLEEALVPPRGLVDLARGADLLIQDTMFTREEIATRRGWGHSTAEAAVALARAAGVTRLAGFHHNPQHDDSQLAAREALLAAAYPGAFLAREGDRIAL